MYNICQKSTQGKVNPFRHCVTCLTAVITVIAFYFYETKENLGILNKWTSIVLGISIVGLELGYLLAQGGLEHKRRFSGNIFGFGAHS